MHTPRKVFLIAFLSITLLFSQIAFAVLTPAQLATLKADIQADGTLNSQPNNSDGNTTIANAYNTTASPDFWVYRTDVLITEIGNAFNGTELAGLTTANNTRLQTVAAFSTVVNASLANRRAFFDDIFSGAGGTNTRAALAVLWRRLARRVEKLYATGTGSTASPATMNYEGTLTFEDVGAARNLP